MDEENKKEEFNVYCNSINIAMSHFDVIFDLKEESYDKKEKLGEVKMSPQHAKVLRNMLIDHINRYEEVFGTIQMPDSDKIKELEQQGDVEKEETKNE